MFPWCFDDIRTQEQITCNNTLCTYRNIYMNICIYNSKSIITSSIKNGVWTMIVRETQR